MATRMEFVRSFEATEKGSGRRRRLSIFQEYITTGPSGCEVPGLTSIKTPNGNHVNRLGKGEYEMLGGAFTGSVILTSDDPDAP